MLRGIKEASANWLGKTIMTVVLGLLAVSFTVWGIGDIFRGFGLSELAKIGRTEIGIEQFRQIYVERLQQISRQVGKPISVAEARARGLDRQVLGEVIAATALDERARQLGLGVSEAEIASQIMADPGFRGPSGQFDRARFEALIRQAGYTEARFVADQRRQILRRQILDTIAGDIVVPKTAIEATYRHENETRAIEYVVLDRAQAGNIPPPAPEAMAKYFEDRKGLFRAPEYRKLTLVMVSPADLAKSVAIPDAETRRLYDERRARYIAPERRHVQQIVFPKAEEAQAASERIAKGVSFEALAAERGLQTKDIDLGTIAKPAIVDRDVADAAFALKEGGVSAPVQGRFGTTLVRVLKIEPEQSRSYEQVADEIKRDVALERARGQVSALRDKLEDNRAGGDTLAEAAQKLGLAASTIEAIDRSGRDPGGAPVSGLPQAAELVPAAFASDVGVESDPLQLQGGGYLWYDVTGITPSRERNLDEVKNEVEIRWRNEEIAARLKAKAEAMVEKLKSGAAFKDIAAADRLKVEAASSLKRGDPTETFSAQAINAVFRTPSGAAGSAQGEQTTRQIVFRVTDATVPKLDANSDVAKRIADALRSALANDLLSEYAMRLENEIGVTVNPNALSQVTGGGTN